jgi:hypothetical protein
VPQSPQNCLVSEFSERHFGHLTVTTDPFNQVWLKIIKESRKRQFAFRSPLCPDVLKFRQIVSRPAPLSCPEATCPEMKLRLLIDIQPPGFAPLSSPRRLAKDVLKA